MPGTRGAAGGGIAGVGVNPEVAGVVGSTGGVSVVGGNGATYPVAGGTVAPGTTAGGVGAEKADWAKACVTRGTEMVGGAGGSSRGGGSWGADSRGAESFEVALSNVGGVAVSRAPAVPEPSGGEGRCPAADCST